MIYKPWTDEEDATLRKMISDGKSSSQIGLVLGRSRNAIIGRRHRLGIVDDIHLVRRRDGARTSHMKRMKRLEAPHALPPRRKDLNEQIGQINKTPFTLRYFHVEKGIKAVEQKPLPLPVETATAKIDSLLDLEGYHCRWPLPKADGTGYGYCGCTVAFRESYCIDHYARSRGLTPEQVGVRIAQAEKKRLTVKEAADAA